MKTHYRITENINGLGDVTYNLERSYGFIGRYVMGNWYKDDGYETIEKAVKMLKHNIECDLRDKIVKSKVIK